MQLSILHISDLHRDPANELTNAALLHSLECDRDKYTKETPAIRPPDLILASGDIVYGVKPSVANHTLELERQYLQAEEFLTALTHSFLNGDSDRLVLVPGNHDVSYPTVAKSLRKLSIDSSDPSAQPLLKEYLSRLHAPNSILRWSWDSLAFYEISDPHQYRARLDGFCSFYHRFYKGTRSYASDPAQQYDVFDYPKLNITVAAFNSCYNNDPLNRVGTIHPDSIAQAARQLRNERFRNRLLLAVWHHSISGPPLQLDYMDPDTLQKLIDSGFSIGFHGHQHKPQFIDERFQFGAPRKITVISAGTLCAGPTGLPTGFSRAYNLIQIDTEALRATLHLRRMQNDSFDSPIGGPGFFPTSLKTYIEFQLQPPSPSAAAAPVPALGEAERLIGKKQYRPARDLLESLAPNNDLARRLLLECYVALDDVLGIRRLALPPRSTQEAVYVLDALWANGDRDALRNVLNSDIVKNSPDPTLASMAQKYIERLK
jgi:hypothetical protein